MKKFAILITTKNRLQELIFTLNKISSILDQEEVEFLLCDDGSDDGTYEYVKSNFPNCILFQNNKSKGLIFSRNLLLNATKAEFALSLDDDAHFLSDNPLQEIEHYFNLNPQCGVVSFRIFWGLQNMQNQISLENAHRVKGFVGCGHCWRMQAWRQIPNYPNWFIFYGEEDFAAFQLFKKNIQIHYVPSIFIQHRVNILDRKNNADYQLRQRRSFRSGWYLYFLFYPVNYIPKKLLYTLYIQLISKTFKGNFKATVAIFQAIGDVLINFPKLLKQSNRLTVNEYKTILKLPESKIYWKPENEK